jgi:autotransporter passenger strand-loop-strand repeat protein
MSTVIVSQGNSPYKVSAGGTDSNDVVVSGGSMFVLSAGLAIGTTVSSGGFLTINKGGSGSATRLSGGNETVSGTDVGDFIESGGSQRVAAPGKVISTTVDNAGTLAVLSGGTPSAATVKNGGMMLVAAGGVVVGATITTSAVVSNCGHRQSQLLGERGHRRRGDERQYYRSAGQRRGCQNPRQHN